MKTALKGFASSIMRGIDRFCNWCMSIGAVLMIILPLMMCYEVGMRYFLNRPTTWAVDFSEYLLVYGTFLTVGWLLKEKELITMVFIYQRLSKRGRLILDGIQSLIGMFASFFIGWSGVVTTWDALERMIVIFRPVKVPRFLVLWVIPLGSFVLLILFFRGFVGSLASLILRSDSAVGQEEK